MGQKGNPIGFRVGITKPWRSTWFAGKDYAKYAHQDIKIRKYIQTSMNQAGVSDIAIERPTKSKIIVTIKASKPGVIIGKKGADVEKVKAYLVKETSSEITLNIVEIKKPEADASLIAQSIARQLEKLVSFRKAMKKAMQSASRAGVKGIRIDCSGRLAGAEIARVEWYRQGRVPLHTLRADIDYGFAEALTGYGIIGVRVLVYHGDVQ
jgi:small subunit ribosomal protein S3